MIDCRQNFVISPKKQVHDQVNMNDVWMQQVSKHLKLGGNQSVPILLACDTPLFVLQKRLLINWGMVWSLRFCLVLHRETYQVPSRT